MALAARVPNGAKTGAATGSGGTVSYYVDISDVEQMIDAFEWATSGPSLHRWLMTEASAWFAEDIAARFDEEGDAKSGFWAPLSPTTARIREGLGYPGEGPINHRTGDLESFVTDGRDFTGGTDWAMMDVPGEASNAKLLEKLQTAQYGTSDNSMFPGRSTPARPVLAVSEMNLVTLLEMLGNFVLRNAMMGSMIA